MDESVDMLLLENEELKKEIANMQAELLFYYQKMDAIEASAHDCHNKGRCEVFNLLNEGFIGGEY